MDFLTFQYGLSRLQDLQCNCPYITRTSYFISAREIRMATTKTDPKLALTAPSAKKHKSYEGLTRDQLIQAYRFMFTSRRIDDREILLKRQQKIFFQMSGAGMKPLELPPAWL